MDEFVLIIVAAVLVGLAPIILKLWLTPTRLGRFGENVVADKLFSLANHNSEYRVFNNTILKTLDGTTQVDHIVISPFGIFVIETKNIKGWIFGGERQKRWTQSLKGRRFAGFYFPEKHQFKNPLHQNYKHVKAVQTFLGISPKMIFNVVVFVGDSEFKTEMPYNVMELRELAPFIKTHQDRVIAIEKVEAFTRKLSQHIDEMQRISPDESFHIKNIERNKKQPVCPKCGKGMVLRTAKRGISVGSQFWGCPGYPACKATRNVEV